MGNEFRSHLFRMLFYPLRDEGKIFYKNDDIFNSALALVDSVIRTIRGLMKRMFVSTGNFNWINHLSDIENNYNGTFHSGIRNIPADVFYGIAEPFFNYYTPLEKLPIGNSVRGDG